MAERATTKTVWARVTTVSYRSGTAVDGRPGGETDVTYLSVAPGKGGGTRAVE
jgi:hypothetical protein